MEYLPGRWRASMQLNRLLVRREVVWLLASGAAVALMGLSVISSPVSKQDDNIITVYAAASMQGALDAIDGAYIKSTGVKVIAGYGATSVLVKQIAHEPVADVFVSAGLEWMDF